MPRHTGGKGQRRRQAAAARAELIDGTVADAQALREVLVIGIGGPVPAAAVPTPARSDIPLPMPGSPADIDSVTAAEVFTRQAAWFADHDRQLPSWRSVPGQPS